MLQSSEHRLRWAIQPFLPLRHLRKHQLHHTQKGRVQLKAHRRCMRELPQSVRTPHE